MQIVELGDYSMVIMKDSQDPPWYGVGDVYRKAKERNRNIVVVRRFDNGDYPNYIIQTSSDAVYTAGRLVLFFKEDINPGFKLHDQVILVN